MWLATTAATYFATPGQTQGGFEFLPGFIAYRRPASPWSRYSSCVPFLGEASRSRGLIMFRVLTQAAPSKRPVTLSHLYFSVTAVSLLHTEDQNMLSAAVQVECSLLMLA